MADFLDGSSESETDFKINKDYAEKYNKWRGKEEMQKLKDRYGDVNENGDGSSSSESEEEDLTDAIDMQFLKTLGCLKSNDPRIYNSKEVFFSEPEQPKITKKKKKKEETLTLSDYKRKVLLEKNGVLSDEEDEVRRPMSPTYDEEQRQLRDSFKTALNDSDDEEEEDDLLRKRSQTNQEKEKDEEEYLRWLKGEVKETDNADELEKLKAYWQDPNLDSGEAFLRDFILNKKFLDSENGTQEHPTYEEVVEDLSGDENELQEQENFEHKYNFRFEEPDADFIKRYPRTMENSLRRKDDKRKKKREEIRARKKEEKESRREELNRLKALKRAEILERLESLKEIAGNSADVFNEIDLEGDFDPEEHDKKMQAVFNEDYYAVDDDVQKPEFPPDEELDGENWDNWQGNDDFHGEENFNMDADWNDNNIDNQGELVNKYSFEDEMVDASRRKKRRRRSRFAQVLSQEKPVFDPDQKSFTEYLDEYYKLDYEDIIGGQPVRFPYRNVVANDFGLTTEEILMAKDKELNRWCSLKKTCQYRTDEEEKYDVQAFQKKAQNMNQKMKCLTSLYQKEQEEKDDIPQTENKKKRKRNARQSKQEEESNIDDDRLRAFGINPKKHKNKLKFGKKF